VSHSVHAEAVAPGEIASDSFSLGSQWLCVHILKMGWDSVPAQSGQNASPLNLERLMGDLQAESDSILIRINVVSPYFFFSLSIFALIQRAKSNLLYTW
jgi:hypothetical protein